MYKKFVVFLQGKFKLRSMNTHTVRFINNRIEAIGKNLFLDLWDPDNPIVSPYKHESSKQGSNNQFFTLINRTS
jgi:hypothetical protein